MARNKKTLKIEQLLNRKKFRQFRKGTGNLQSFNQILVQYLQDSMKQRCQVTNFEKTTLSISVDSGATATKLRYEIPILKQNLAKHAEFYNLKTIKFHIRKDVVVSKPEPYRPMRRLSQRNAELIKHTAAGISDPSLSAALIRLSRNT